MNEAGSRNLTPSFLHAIRTAAHRGDYEEFLDQDGVPEADLAQNLYHLRLMNRWLGWSAGVWDEVAPFLQSTRDTLSLLDLATGSADVPRDLIRRAKQQGRPVRLIGSDVNADVLRVAAGQPAPRVELVQHDATALPFASRSIDIVTMSLAAHHLDPPVLTASLAEAWRVSRRAVIVSDLERGRVAYMAARVMALLLRNPLTSHDGPVSVLRAYTVPEIAALARRAGLGRVRIRRRFPFRLTLVARKDKE